MNRPVHVKVVSVCICITELKSTSAEVQLRSAGWRYETGDDLYYNMILYYIIIYPAI